MTFIHLFRTAIRDAARPGRLIVATLLALLPAAIAVLWRLSARGSFQPGVAYDALEAGLVYGFTLVILSVIFGTGVVSQEVEQGTIVYLLTRPVSRTGILLSRFLAALMMVIATSWAGSLALALATFGASHLKGAPLVHDALILAIGALAYGGAFVFLATFVMRPLLWGLLFAFGWEWWVPSLPGNIRMLSLMAYLRVLAPHPSPEADSVDLGSLLSALNPTEISQHLAWLVLFGVITSSLIGALFLFTHREYVPRDAE